MRRVVAGAAALVVAACSSATQAPVPLPPSAAPSTPPAPLEDVAVDGTHDVWVLEGRELVHSSDDGDSWHLTRTFASDPTEVRVIDESHVRVLTTAGLTGTDDGRTWWTSRLTATDVSFGDSTFGVALHGRQLLITRDGGHTWRAAPAPGDLSAVAAGPDRSIWAGTDSGAISENGRTIGTAPRSIYGPLAVTEIQPAGPDTAWVLAALGQGAGGQQPHVTLRIAVDGTETVADTGSDMPEAAESETRRDHALFLSAYPGAISAISPTEVAIAGDSPAATDAIDAEVIGGPATQSHTLPGSRGIGAIAFSSPLDGWLVTRDADQRTRLHHTEDGGITWTTVDLGQRSSG